MAKLSYKTRELPEPGKHLVTLVSVEEVANKFFDPQKDQPDRAKQLEWTFEYQDKPGVQIKVWSSPTLSIFKGTKSKALTIVEALMGKELTEEEKQDFPDTEILIGKTCYLDVRHQKTEDGQLFAKVKEFESESSLLP